MRAIALGLVFLAAGCGGERVQIVDAHLYDLKKVGVTCAQGMHVDEAHGCTLDVAPGEAGLKVVHRDEMSAAFELISALYALDGRVLFSWNRDEAAGGTAPKEIPVFEAAVPPGEHSIAARLVYRGHGEGVFAYLKGYKFEVRSSHAFTAVPGRTTFVTGTGAENGGLTKPLEERPVVRWSDQ